MLTQLSYSYSNNFHRNQNHKNISFKGLNRYLSKHFIEAGTCKITGEYKTAEQFVTDAIEKYPKSRRFVGNLPPEWISRLPKETRSEQIKEIQDLFAELAKRLQRPKQESGYYFDFSDFIASLKKYLQTDITVGRLPAGEIGKAYRLEVGNKPYVFKVFHSDISPSYKEIHGQIIEPSRAPYIKKKRCKSFVDFYFGRIGINENKDGFMLTQFENHNQNFSYQEEIKRLLRLLKCPLISADIIIYPKPRVFDSDNILGLKIIDFGDLRLLPQNVNESLRKTSQHIAKYCFGILSIVNKNNLSEKNSKNLSCILEEIDKAKAMITLSHKDDNIHEMSVHLNILLSRVAELLQNPT